MNYDKVEQNLTNSIQRLDQMKNPLFKMERDILRVLKTKIDKNLLDDIE